jgi:hypothetical protein
MKRTTLAACILAACILIVLVVAASAQPAFTSYDNQGRVVGGSTGGRAGTINNLGRTETFVSSPDGKRTTFTKSDGSRYTLTTRRINQNTVDVYQGGRFLSRHQLNGGTLTTYGRRGNVTGTARTH